MGRIYFIIGADGFVGQYLYRLLRDRGEQVHGTYFSYSQAGLTYLDMRDAVSCQDVLKTVSTDDIVIQVAACAHVDHCELNASTDAINIQGTQHLIDEVRTRGAYYVFFSSEYVFDGMQGPYREVDIPHPLNRYGSQKLWAEHYLASNISNNLIVRTTTVYGFEAAGKSFLMSLTARLRRNEIVRVPYDQISTPTFVEDLVRLTLSVIDVGYQGIINIVGAELMSRYTFALRIAHALHLPTKLIQPVTTAALGQAAERPLNAGLRIDKLLSLGVGVPTSLSSALTTIRASFDIST